MAGAHRPGHPTGLSVWHRDHLDPCLRELRPSNGPFAGCIKGEHQVDHRMPGIVPSAWRCAQSDGRLPGTGRDRPGPPCVPYEQALGEQRRHE
ncbi:DUF4913 domain-containing protein [Streptomyces sp. R33]|uniref:DUF4913 domain-containing protein n=1 Tax=Streptomyces sp. R33 TaxID=3238629 RepID=UPI00350EE747